MSLHVTESRISMIVPIVQRRKTESQDRSQLIEKVRKFEKQAGKLRVRSTLYSLFGNTDLDKVEKRFGELEREIERQRLLSEKEKTEIRKEVILLQDNVAAKNKTIVEQQKKIKAYEEARSFIQRFFHSFTSCSIFVCCSTRWILMAIPLLECTISS